MAQVKNIVGLQKKIFILKVKVSVFLHFLMDVLKGKLKMKRFFPFLKRLLIFVDTIKHNKFVKIGRDTRMDLYVPGFHSKAFYTACEKFMVFEERMPCITVLISITSACKYNCSHCYQKHDKGKDLDLDILIKTVKKLQNMGIAFFNIEGGEPFMVYERLKSICDGIDYRSEIWINSTGVGITKERLLELKNKNVTAIMFSLHSPEPKTFNKFMKSDEAWDTFIHAVDLCHEVGMPVAINTCLMKEDFYNGSFEKIMEVAKKLRVCLVQIIKPKPSGGWMGKEDFDFKERDIQYIKERVNTYNLDHKYKEYPSISAQIIEEDSEVFGCTAGGVDRFYINAKGDVQPCEFLNMSFGNIGVTDFEFIYKKMRNCFSWGGDCALCEKYAKDIYNTYKENNLSTLPISPELSERIYTSWNRGEKTALYEKLEKVNKN